MKIRCVWEHNGDDTILYAENAVGAFTRGPSREAALDKMASEVGAYLKWAGLGIPKGFSAEIVQEKESSLQICDADSDVIFEGEKEPLTVEEYAKLKKLALRSAADFYRLYLSIPDKGRSCLPARQTFYGDVPRTAEEMYEHTKNVNSYYFGEIGVNVSNDGTIYECRKRGFELLEKTENYLANGVICGSYDEFWSLRKVMRRFIWHDRIHAKAMYRMAVKTFGDGSVENVFQFAL